MNAFSKKRAALIVISVIICASLFAAYFIIRHLQNVKDDGDDDDLSVGRLIDLNTEENISSIKINNENGEIEIIRSNGGWHFSSYPNLPVSEDAVALIESELEYIVSLRDLPESENPELERYGLDDPARTVSFTYSGQTKTYYFGSPSSYYNGHYFTSGNGRVYIVTASLYERLGVSLEDMLSVDKMPLILSTSGLVFTDTKGNELTIGKDDKLYEALLTLDIDRYVDYGSENYEIYGFENSALLTIDDTDTIRLCIGESDEFVYMLIGESEMIYLAKTDDRETLVNCIRDVISSSK